MTPGPWKVLERKDARGRPCGYAIWPDLERPYADSPRGNQIAATPDGTTPEARANARLMAAAPDLLEALQRIRETGVFVGAIAQEMMEAAITKALTPEV